MVPGFLSDALVIFSGSQQTDTQKKRSKQTQHNQQRRSPFRPLRLLLSLRRMNKENHSKKKHPER